MLNVLILLAKQYIYKKNQYVISVTILYRRIKARLESELYVFEVKGNTSMTEMCEE